MSAKQLESELGQPAAIGQFVAECEVAIGQFEPTLEYRREELQGFVRGCWPCEGEPVDVAAQFSQKVGVQQIEDVLRDGGYLATDDQPCAAVAHFDEGSDTPWRVSDDYTSESYATLEEAKQGAEAWCELIAAELKAQDRE
jgi:hypothetical protein